MQRERPSSGSPPPAIFFAIFLVTARSELPQRLGAPLVLAGTPLGYEAAATETKKDDAY